MRAINHALSGALIGLTVSMPALALPLAFASHFLQDAIPHHDMEGEEAVRLGTRRFMQQLLIDGIACVVLVTVLALVRPESWLLAVVGGFLATSPDLMWLRRLRMARTTGKIAYHEPWWERFHSRIQWATGPRYWWVEALWLAGASYLLWRIVT